MFPIRIVAQGDLVMGTVLLMVYVKQIVYQLGRLVASRIMVNLNFLAVTGVHVKMVAVM